MILTTTPQPDYELIDSGSGKKLERYGKFVLSRPDPQVLWLPLQPEKTWRDADATFLREGKNVKWKKVDSMASTWTIIVS